MKVENPSGMRIQKAYIGETLLDPDKTYYAAFVTVQGVPTRFGTNRENLPLHAIDALRRYINKHKVLSPTLQGTIQVI